MAGEPAPHIMIVEARFYEDIADVLVRGALLILDGAGASHEHFRVPGAFEIPAAIAMAHAENPARFDGYLALGCVIRGETSHYDYVCGESARGLQDLAVGHGLAIGYGILTVENQEQAWERAAVSGLDKRRRPVFDKRGKGGVAADACLDMIALKKKLKSPRE